MKILSILEDLKETCFDNIRHQRFYELKEKLKNEGYKNIAVYGTGNHTKLLLEYLDDFDINIVALLDKDKSKRGGKILGYEICDLDSISDSIDVIVISSDVFQDIIYDRLKGMELKNIEIIKIYKAGDLIDTERTYLHNDEELNIESRVFYKPLLAHINRYMWSLAFTRNKKVLDIACGGGYGTDIIADNALQVTGVDIDDRAIKYANKYFKNDKNNFVCSSIEEFESSDKYDVILSFETLEHIKNDKVYIQKMKGLMKPQGCFIVSTPFAKEDGAHNSCNPYHINEYTEGRFIELIKNNFKDFRLYIQLEEEIGAITFREAFKSLKPYSNTMIAVCYEPIV